VIDGDENWSRRRGVTTERRDLHAEQANAVGHTFRDEDHLRDRLVLSAVGSQTMRSLGDGPEQMMIGQQTIVIHPVHRRQIDQQVATSQVVNHFHGRAGEEGGLRGICVLPLFFV